MSDAIPNAKATIRDVLDRVKADKRTSLTAPEGKLVCDAYGIPVPKEGVAKSAAEAAKLASDMGFPVVMKIVSPDILHKTEAGGVIVGVKTADDAQKAYETILANAKKYKADAKIEGIQVQQMLTGGTEVIVGSITDGSFGTLVAFGLGHDGQCLVRFLCRQDRSPLLGRCLCTAFCVQYFWHARCQTVKATYFSAFPHLRRA